MFLFLLSLKYEVMRSTFIDFVPSSFFIFVFFFDGRSARSKSMAYPPPPAFGSPHAIRAGVHRSGSMNAGAGKTGRIGRPDWAHQFDPAKHEYAVTTGSSASGYD